MTIYERFGVKPFISVAGTMTRYGGSLMGEEAREAMNEAAKYSVRLDELQAAASKVIAEKTHAEAGIVTCGTFSANALAVAACIAGLDVARMNRLPDTAGMPNEVIVPWHQISGWCRSFQLPNARMVCVGIPNSTPPPDEVHIISKWDIESAITEKTVAIAYTARSGNHPPLEEVIEVSKRYNVPVIVDAAGQVPPVENLHRFIDIGVDLVCFSGGKGIRGYQASGILCGRRTLIASAALQMMDMAGEPFDEWDPPTSLIPKDSLHGKPQPGIGRGMKVTKEAIVGLLVALQNLTEEGLAKEIEHSRQLIEGIQTKLEDIAGLEMRVVEEEAYPILEVKIDEKVVGRSAVEVCKKLKDNGIYIRDFYREHNYPKEGLIVIHSVNLDEETAKIVGERLYTAITG